MIATYKVIPAKKCVARTKECPTVPAGYTQTSHVLLEKGHIRRFSAVNDDTVIVLCYNDKGHHKGTRLGYLVKQCFFVQIRSPLQHFIIFFIKSKHNYFFSY